MNQRITGISGPGDGGPGRGRFGANIDAVATLLNMSIDDLEAATAGASISRRAHR